MKKYFIIFILLSFSFQSSKKTQKTGFLIYKLTDENNLYFVENIDFIHGDKINYFCNLTQIFYYDSDHPFMGNNFNYLTKVYFNRKYPKDVKDSFYYAKINIDSFEYYTKRRKEFKYKHYLFFNNKRITFNHKYLTDARIKYE